MEKKSPKQFHYIFWLVCIQLILVLYNTHPYISLNNYEVGHYTDAHDHASGIKREISPNNSIKADCRGLTYYSKDSSKIPLLD